MPKVAFRRASKKQIESKINKNVGATLYDVLPILKDTKAFDSTSNSTAEEIKNIFYMIDNTISLSEKLNSRDKYSKFQEVRNDTKPIVEKALSDIRNKVKTTLLSNDVRFPTNIVNPGDEEIKLADRLGIYNHYMGSDNDLISSNDLIKMSKLCKIKSNELLNIVDKLSLILIPGDFLNKDSITSSFNIDLTKIALEKFRLAFDNFLGENYYFYVACPLSHYSFYNHINSDTQALPIYTKNFNVEFTTIAIQIPVLRGMKQQIENIENEVLSLKKEHKYFDDSINNLSERLKQVEKVSKEQQKVAIEQNYLIQNLISSNTSLERRVRELERICAADPIAVAVPKQNVDSNFTNMDGNCLIGPCWGPEFEMFTILSNNLNLYVNQRDYLQSIIDSTFLKGV